MTITMVCRYNQASISPSISHYYAHAVSLVDGFNLPMSITNDVGCEVGLCAVNLLTDCKNIQLAKHVIRRLSTTLHRPNRIEGRYGWM